MKIVVPRTPKHFADLVYLAMDYVLTPNLDNWMTQDEMANYTIRAAQNPNSIVRMAYEGEEAVGYILITHNVFERRLWVEAIYVKESFRGQGIGQQLVWDCVQEILATTAQELLFKTMTLSQRVWLKLTKGIKPKVRKVYVLDRVDYAKFREQRNARTDKA